MPQQFTFYCLRCPLTALLSIARAHNKVRHILRLIDRGDIINDELPNIVALLRSEMGITINKWTIEDFIATFEKNELNMLTLMPPIIKNRNMRDIMVAIQYVYSPHLYVPLIFEKARKLLTKLANVDLATRSYYYTHGWMIGGHGEFLLSYDMSTFYPIDILIEKSNVSSPEVLAYVDHNPNIEPDMQVALRAYYGGANELDPTISRNVLNYVSNFNLVSKLYYRQNHGFYEFLSRNNPDSLSLRFIDVNLVMRAFSNELVHDSTLHDDVCATIKDLIASFKPKNKSCHIRLDVRKMFKEWHSFAISIGIPPSIINEICFHSFFKCDVAVIIFIFGPQSIVHYEKYYNKSVQEFVTEIAKPIADIETLIPNYATRTIAAKKLAPYIRHSSYDDLINMQCYYKDMLIMCKPKKMAYMDVCYKFRHSKHLVEFIRSQPI